MSPARFSIVIPVIGFMFFTLLQLSYGQSMAPSPAPQGPSSNGTAIDQGVACLLLVVALVITYLIH